MDDVTAYHRQAMDAADRADEARRHGDTAKFMALMREALQSERAAALLVTDDLTLEPTRSVLHRSAASLAIEAGEYDVARELINRGLAGQPPPAVADELHTLLIDARAKRRLSMTNATPSEWPLIANVGFTIRPSQKLILDEKERLDRDLTNLLTSLTYSPPHIRRTVFDLRYLMRRDVSISRRHFEAALLVRLDFDPEDPPANPEVTRLHFADDLYNLLTLYLNDYQFQVDHVGADDLQDYLQPFPIEAVVEITRRPQSDFPVRFSQFEGKSTMTRVIDMLSREPGQCCYSVLLEPYALPLEQARQLQAFGYEANLPGIAAKREDDSLTEVLDLVQGGQRKDLEEPSFRMKVRLFSDSSISQYLVNLVGAEVAGHAAFLPVRLELDRGLSAEVEAIESLDFLPTLSTLAEKMDNIPPLILDLVYLFGPVEAVKAFRLPSERISVAPYRTYFAPINQLPVDGILLGHGTHPSEKDPIAVKLQDPDRRRHMYLVGKTGTGKSMMLLGMLIQDIRDGKGLCLIDPHGDLVDTLLAYIPEERREDVYVFDPSDRNYVTGLNLLEATSGTEEEKDYIVQEIISILLRTVDYDIGMFGPRAQQWTRYGCMTLMDLPRDSDLGGTLLEVPRLFSDERFLHEVLSEISSDVLKQYWNDEFASMADFHKSEMMGYFTSKFTPLITAPQVRNIVGQRTSGFDFSEIIEGRKILLVNLASGKIGRRNSELLGSAFVSRLLWTAMRRAWRPQETRSDFYLYVDEFQNFITDSFEIILSEARKYGLNLVIAHQHLSQLTAMGRMGDKLERSVFGNVGTMVAFRMGPDALVLASELGEPADPATLRNLENRITVTKLLVEDRPTVAFTMRTVDLPVPSADEVAAGLSIKASSVRKWGRAVSDVDAEIQRRYARLGKT